MNDLRERINDLSDDAAKNLAKALDSFQCHDSLYLSCNKCPLCQQDGVCLFVLVDDRVKFGKC